MIHAMLTITAPDGQRDQLLRDLRLAAAPVCVESGCVRCLIVEDVEEPGTFTMMEEWLTGRDWERHVTSAGYRRILQLAEISARAPVVRFNDVWRTLGIDAVQLLRNGGDLDLSDAGDCRNGVHETH